MAQNFTTAVRQVDYPIHQGKPNPKHGKFYFVGSVPAACWDHERQGSKFYDTEAEALAAADAGGSEYIQRVDCSFYKHPDARRITKAEIDHLPF